MRRHAVLLVLVAGAALSLVGLAHPYYDATNDGSMYIATTRALLAGDGYTFHGEPFVMRPPGFSVLLMPVLALFGTSFLALNLYVSAFGVAAVAFFFVWLRPRFGLWPALAMAVAVWLNPGFRSLCGQVLSDVPGVALLFGLLLVERWGRRSRSAGREVLLGVLIGVSAYVRSASLLLVPALLLARLLHRRKLGDPPLPWPTFVLRRLVPLAVIPLLLLVPWRVRNAIHQPATPTEQTFNYDYSVAMWNEDPADPDSPRLPLSTILARAPENLGKVVPLLGSRMKASEYDTINLVLGLAGLGCWLAVLLRRRDGGSLYALLYLPVLAFYFAFANRLVLPLYMLVLPAVVEVVLWVLRRWLKPAPAAATAAVLVLALAAVDFAPRHEWDEIAARHRGMQDVVDYIETAFPPGTPVAASVGWHYAVYLERPVPSVLWTTLREGLPGAYRVLAREGTGVIVINRQEGGQRRLYRHFAHRFGVEREMPEGIVIRVPRPEALIVDPSSFTERERRGSRKRDGAQTRE